MQKCFVKKFIAQKCFMEKQKLKNWQIKSCLKKLLNNLYTRSRLEIGLRAIILRAIILRAISSLAISKLASRRNNEKRELASISLLASICLAAILTLESVLLPASFLRKFEAAVPDYVNLQLQTVLASYKRDLFKRYALMAFNKSEARTSELDKLVAKQARSYQFTAQIRAKQALGEAKILKKAILKYMKPRMPLAALRTFHRRFTELRKCLTAQKKDLAKLGKDADEVKNKLDKLKKQATMPKTKSKWQKLLAQGLDKALDYCFDGYSQFKELASSSNIHTETVASFAKLFNQAKQILDNLEKVSIPGLDDILLNEYLLGFLSSAVRNLQAKIPASNQISDNLTLRKQIFQSLSFSSPYELENCMSFFNGQSAYLQVQTQIFAIRLALQVVAVRQNKTQQAVFLAISEIIALAAALLGIPIAPELVKHFLTAITAGIRAFKDLRNLQAGKMLALVPAEIVQKNNLPKQMAKFQHDYFDYARLFLLLTKQSHRLQQLYKAIQANLPGDYYCQTSIKTSWQAPKWTFHKSNYQSELAYITD